jgi:hypothetical protein
LFIDGPSRYRAAFVSLSENDLDVPARKTARVFTRAWLRGFDVTGAIPCSGAETCAERFRECVSDQNLERPFDLDPSVHGDDGFQHFMLCEIETVRQNWRRCRP